MDIFSFWVSQHTLTILIIIIYFQYVITNFKISIFSTLFMHQPIDELNYLSTPRISYCYLIITDSFKSINSELPVLASINTNAKYVFLFTNSTQVGAEMFVTSIWSSHKMKNCISIVIIENEEFEGSFEVNAVIYNPFAYDDGVRGHVSFYNINSSTFQNASIEMVQNIVDADKNYYGYPIKVYMYEWPAWSRAVVNESNPNQILRYTLLDGEILNLFVKFINFTPIFYGSINNSFQESLEVIESETVDVVTNSRIIADYGTENTVFLQPVDVVELRYMVPKRHSTRALNVLIYSLFDFETSLGMIAVFIVLILIWFSLNFYYERFTNQTAGNSIPRALLIVTATQYFNSINISRFKGYQQVLLGFMLIYGILVSSNFQSSVVKQLQTEVSDADINTLLKLRDSGLKIYHVQTVDQFILVPENQTTSSVIFDLFKIHNNLNISVQKAAYIIQNNRTIAVLCTSKVAYEFQSNMFDRKTGLDTIFVIPQAPVVFYNSFVMPKSSPFRMRFNEVLRELIECGFVRYETEVVKRNVQMGYIRRAKLNFQNHVSLFMPISPDQLRSLFYIWGYLMTIAFSIFIIEILTKFMNNNKKINN